jgi:hypothetical protein
MANDQPLTISYSLLGKSRSSPALGAQPEERQTAVSLTVNQAVDQQPATINKLLPAKNFSPQRYWERSHSGRETLDRLGIVEYLQQITAGASNLDRLVLIPVLEEQDFLSGYSDYYSWAAGQSLFKLAPYLTDSGASEPDQRPVTERRQVAIINALFNRFLPTVDRYLQLETKLASNPPQIDHLGQVPEVVTYIQESFRRWLPRVPENKELANDLYAEAVFRYSGWAALIIPGLLAYPSAADQIAEQAIPAGQFWTVVNSAYHRQPHEHWYQYEQELFADLIQEFEQLIIELVDLKD